MRLSKPRIAPLSDAELNPEQAEALEAFRPGPVLNIFRTLGGLYPVAAQRPAGPRTGDRDPAHRLSLQVGL